MSEKQSKRLRAVELRQIEQAKLLKMNAEITATLTTDVMRLKRCEDDRLDMIRQRNEARTESRRAAAAVRWWRGVAYAALIGASAVLLVAALATQEPEAKAVDLPEPVVVQTVEELAEDPDESQKIEDALLARAIRYDHVTVSHYCLCPKCCGKQPSDPGYGVTASGTQALPGVTVGVDPDAIPLGSTVMVDYGDGELHYYRADDTGSGVHGAQHIDLCVSSHQEALNLGLRTATIWVAEEG